MAAGAFSREGRERRQADVARMRERWLARRSLRHKPDPVELKRSQAAERLALSTISTIKANRPRSMPEPSLSQLAHACRVAARCVSNDALTRTLEIAAGYFDDADGHTDQ